MKVKELTKKLALNTHYLIKYKDSIILSEEGTITSKKYICLFNGHYSVDNVYIENDKIVIEASNHERTRQ